MSYTFLLLNPLSVMATMKRKFQAPEAGEAQRSRIGGLEIAISAPPAGMRHLSA